MERTITGSNLEGRYNKAVAKFQPQRTGECGAAGAGEGMGDGDAVLIADC